MSLINEALKKARVEAAQRDARQRGVLVPKAAAYGPRRRTGRIAAAAVGAVLALGLAAAGGMWLARRGLAAGAGGAGATPEAVTAEPGGPIATEAAGATVADAGGPAPAPAVRGETEVPTASATSQPNGLGRTREADTSPAPGAGEPGSAAGTETTTARAPASSPAVAEAPAQETLQRPREPARTRPAPPRRAPTAPRAEPGYVREAPLPSGGTLRLDGIAWSETAPTAVIDGQIVGPGERIRGTWVRRIERDRVVLEADGSEIVVRLR